MPVREPRWWYREGGRAAGLLGPIERVWSWAAVRRIARTTPVRCSLPVICIGNFTAGGTGKTPLSLLIAERLQALGERPVFLTRGYGGRIAGPHRVNPALDTASDVGDEPLLLARRAPVIVARDRVAGAQLAAAEAGNAPPSVIVMDDGLQNPALAKDLTIAVVDAARGLGNRHVIPAGPLRAPLDVQFNLADAIVVNAAPDTAPDRAHAVAEELRSRFHGPVIEARVAVRGEALGLEGAAVLALAGIANPGRFYALLEQQGARLVGRAEFKDHHAFTETDAAQVLGEAARLQARIVTTEKDLVRLEGRGGRLAELREQAVALPIGISLEAREEMRLHALIDAALIGRRKPEAMASKGVADPSQGACSRVDRQ